MPYSNRGDVEKMIRERWFPGHIAKRIPQAESAGIEVIRWRKPGTSVYFISYMIRGPYLIVTGDVGDAIYRFSENLSLDLLVACEVDYFASKCTASENGRCYPSWDPDAATAYLEEWIKGGIDDEDIEKRRRSLCSENSAFTACQWKEDWKDWLEVFGSGAFGPDWIEFGEIGRAVDIRCMGHLIGLKMACAQLREQEKVEHV
jgi:hypothetical protein